MTCTRRRGQTANLAPAKYRLRGAVRCGRAAGRLRSRAAHYVRTGGRLLVALGHRAARARCRSPTTRGETSYHVARARFSKPPHGWIRHPSIQKRNVGRREVLPGRARGPRHGARGRPPGRRDAAADRSAGGEGHVLVFASTFDNIANDFPLHPAFVPFIEQTARYLAAGMEARPAQFTVGSLPRAAPFQEAGRRGGRAAIPRASACSRWRKPPRRRTCSSPWRVSTISIGPTGSRNWWR